MLKRFLLLMIVATAMVSATPPLTTDVCTFSKDVGRCRGRKIMFRYNQDEGRCELFLYGGCGGNANRFTSLLECHERCGHLMDENVKSPHIKGDHCLKGPLVENSTRACMGAFPRFTFDKDTLNCQRYLYGGCLGTENLFTSPEECASSCIHGDILRPTSTQRVRYQVNSATTRTRGALPVNKPTDASSIIYPDEDICQLPPLLPGIFACLAFNAMWTYDAAQGKCVSYVYGGCRGTDNLFISENECKEKCLLNKAKPKSVAEWERPDTCLLPPITGNISCLRFQPMFTFDAETEACVPYIYGGCRGTDNLYTNHDECLKKCDASNQAAAQPRLLDVCSMPIVKGRCYARFWKFGFNSETSRCEKFAYGGCGGNDNNFDSMEACVNTCGGLNEPAESLICSETECENYGLIDSFYRGKGCTPIIKPGECCSNSWDCSRWDERMEKLDKCFAVSKNFPNGKFYEIGESMDELNTGCSIYCRCEEGYPDRNVAQMDCSHIDCFGWDAPKPKGELCVQVQSEVDTCCPGKNKCDKELDELHTCTDGNKTYYEGQTFTPTRDKCATCICKPGFDADDTSSEFCYRSNCYSYRDYKMKNGCVPAFTNDDCCPWEWVCPDEVHVEQEADNETEEGDVSPKLLTCPEGSEPNPPYNVPFNAKVEESAKTSDDCLLSKAVGPCTGFADRFYFDSKTRTCKTFKFGGFSEVGNVFESAEQCKTTCGKYALDEADTAECEAAETERPSTREFDRCMPSARYRYNRATGRCEDFSFMGCRRNKNSYRTIDECEARCGNNSAPVSPIAVTLPFPHPGVIPPCNLPAERGFCYSRLSRYYYDSATGICKQFFYGGCRGNGNNYKTEGECILTCVTKESLDRALVGFTEEVKSPCNQEKTVGRCRAKKPAYYFDKASKTCRLFFYGGCGGNANRFSTLGDCINTCDVDENAMRELRLVCAKPREQDTCEDTLTRYFFNSRSGRCENFDGCDTTTDEESNNFASRDECLVRCQFSLKNGGVIASGRGPTVQVGNAVTLPISLNDNSLITVSSSTPDDAARAERDDACHQSVERGMCKAAFPRFHFDATLDSCKPFLYGGCGGNKNNFASKEDCEQKCVESSSSRAAPAVAPPQQRSLPVAVTEPRCSLAVDIGRCRALKPKFYFDYTSKSCKRFFYGGCEGNDNRFDSFEDCSIACLLSAELEHTPAVVNKQQQCELGNDVFNLGDLVLFANNRCKSCVCDSPPYLSCRQKKCTEFGKAPHNDCRLMKTAEGGCCHEWKCSSGNDVPYADKEE